MAHAGIGSSVEGVHAVAAALAAGRVRKLFVEERRVDRLHDLIEQARGVTLELVDDVRPMAATTAPQGVVARCDPIPPLSLEQAVALTTPAALLVLDHVEDPRNVGAIARSALAAGIRAMVVSGRRSAPVDGTAFKAAAGALEKVAVVEVSSVASSLASLKEQDVWTVGLDALGDQPLFGLELLTEPVALVVGAEGEGLSRLAAERCDVVAHIPMVRGTESLNASVAASLACFEVFRVRRSAG